MRPGKDTEEWPRSHAKPSSPPSSSSTVQIFPLELYRSGGLRTDLPRYLTVSLFRSFGELNDTNKTLLRRKLPTKIGQIEGKEGLLLLGASRKVLQTDRVHLRWTIMVLYNTFLCAQDIEIL